MGISVMKLAEIKDGKVVNVIVVDAAEGPWEGWPEIPEGAGINWDYDGSTFTAPPRKLVPLEQLSKGIRERRNVLLQESDWVVTKAVEQNAVDGLGIQVPMVWVNYRQDLRDLPAQSDFPNNVLWPQKP